MRASEILHRLPTERQERLLDYVDQAEARGEITTLILAGLLRYVAGDGLERTAAIPLVGEVS